MKSNKCYRLLLLLLLTIGFLYSKVGIAQNTMKVHVKFKIEGEKADFANGVKLVLFIKGQEIEPLLYINGFVIPDFKEIKEVDVCFIYGGSNYFFKGLPVSKFETDWVFGILKRPKNKDNRREYYIKFNPKDGGDGTFVTVTE